MSYLLDVKNISIDFATDQGKLRAIKNVSLQILPGEIVGIVGESGSGKSVTSLAIMDLLATNAEIVSGEIFYKDKNLLAMKTSQRRKMFSGQMAMIFQDPMTSLNPVFRVGDQIVEALQIHTDLKGQSLRDRVIELMNEVGIPDPASRWNNYPHQLSGGLAQRVMIALAMACSPELLIADEPTTALDVTIQSQILSLLRRLQKQNNMSVLLISHDMGVIAQNTSRVCVMYAGEVAETGMTAEVLKNPKHPYTAALIQCLPGNYKDENENFRIPSIPGVVPSLRDRPLGCQFHPRCHRSLDRCRKESPSLSQENPKSSQFSCWNPL